LLHETALRYSISSSTRFPDTPGAEADWIGLNRKRDVFSDMMMRLTVEVLGAVAA